MKLDTGAMFDVYFPPTIRLGKGSLSHTGQELRNRGFSKCFVVTDEGVVRAGMADKLVAILGEAEIEDLLFPDVLPNPGTRVVEKGSELYLQSKSDCLVAIGGGSSIDTAKAIGVLVSNGGAIMDYEGVGKVSQPLPYLIAIPTTYGSGSEVTSFTVITDERRKFKAAIGSPHVIPRLAIIDPELTATLPREIRTAVGMDALCHGIESYTSRYAQPFSQALAFHAIRLIYQNIKLVVAGKDDLEASLQMGVASAMAGMAFSQSRLGIVHAMAHPLGGHYNIPHGIANALLLPYIMEFNAGAVSEKFKEIAEAMGIARSTDGSGEAAKRAIDAVKELQVCFSIPTRLSQLEVKDTSVESLAADAMLSGNVQANPRDTTLEDIIDLYRQAI